MIDLQEMYIFLNTLVKQSIKFNLYRAKADRTK